MAENGSKVKTPPRGYARFLADMRRYDREHMRRALAKLPPATTVGEILPGSTRRRTFLVRVVSPSGRMLS